MKTYIDGRPNTALRLQATDAGVVLKHGDVVDEFNARDAWVFSDGQRFYMHYDAASDLGWLSALAISDDGVQWRKRGAILELGAAGQPDSASASYGTTFFDGANWHMFYLGTPNTMMPGKVPAFPYQTLKAQSATADGTWVKQAGVIPIAAMPNTFYADTASPGMVVQHGQDFLMFFSAAVHQSDGIKRTIGLARTRDLLTAWMVDAEPVFPISEQIENSSLYFETSSNLWFLFTNHIGIDPETGAEYTDAIWVYWSENLTQWNPDHKAVVLDSSNCTWSKKIIGLPSVLKIGDRLAVFYDGYRGSDLWHMGRDIGLAWLELPLIPPQAQS